MGYTTPDLDPNKPTPAGRGSAGPAQVEGVAAELEGFFDGVDLFDMSEVSAKLEAHFRKGVGQLGRQLIADHSGEKHGVMGHHTFHGFEAGMKAAFPGWPEDTSRYYDFLGCVFFREGGGVILGNEQEIRNTFKRFTDSLWQGKEFPENRFWPMLKTLAEGVKYCQGDYAEQKYRVEVGPAIKRRGDVFDSKALYDRKIVGRYLSGAVSPSQDEMKCRCIWVMSWPDGEEPAFYTHIGKFGRFHHSSFKAGDMIMAAGEWVIGNGKLTHINACSGHYKPEAWRFLTACTYLKNKHVIGRDTLLEVWWQGTDRQLVPCLEFLMRFTQNLQSGYQLYKA